jgi:hypothetical protein
MDDLLSGWNEQHQNLKGNEAWTEIPGIPDFQHAEIRHLYAWGFDIPHSLVKTILGLPRASLIEDLHLVLDDAEKRYEAYQALNSEDRPIDQSLISFPAHALFLLAEMNAQESLGKVLKFIGKDYTMVDFWLGDHLSEDLWQVLFVLGKENLDRLQKFARNQNIDLVARLVPVTAVTQIAWHYSGRRKEVFAWFESLFSYYLENFNDETDDDAEFLSHAIHDAAELRAVDLLDTIESLYNEDLVWEGVAGSFLEVQGDMYEPVNNWAKTPVKNIYETYQHFTDTWSIYSDTEEEESSTYVSGGAYLQAKEKKKPLTSFNPETKPVKKEAGPGRNDLCPCGSGLKYKKCHGA